LTEKTVAVVFPGQGSQRPGMGKDFYSEIKECREVYEEASDSLGWDVAAMCFGEDDRLNMTEFTQPCIVATEIAMLRGLKALYEFSPEFFGGHSLGEFTALVASGFMPFAAAVKIVHVRGRLMQEAVAVGTGSMSAVISENLDTENIRTALSGIPVDIANINSANQIVISGAAAAMPYAEELMKDALGGRPFRFVALNVSAPFHSRFMSTIKNSFLETLQKYGSAMIAEKATCVTSNYTGDFHCGNISKIQGNLVAQLSNAVNWRSNMEQLSSKANSIYEVGPGRPLRDFFKTIGVGCSSITTLSAARKTLEENL
jgi:[acyl-carrier-protein] S-malonyltransferase/trans-AT polyketide synthase/acyltransferase/oxidoreductase domain-containing protein